MFRCTRGDYTRVFFATREAAGATGTRHSPRPHFYRARNKHKPRTHCAARVIRMSGCRHCERSEAIQLTFYFFVERWIASSRSLSSGAHSRDPLAPRNDGMGCLTIESVGRFFARSRNALNCHHPRRRVIQYSGTSAMEPHRRSVLDTPHARGMTSVGGDASVQNAARAYCFLRRAVAAAATSACSPSRHRKISTASTG